EVVLHPRGSPGSLKFQLGVLFANGHTVRGIDRAVFQKDVQVLDDVRGLRTRQDAAVAERPMAPLHLALEPTNYVASHPGGNHLVDQLLLRKIVVRQLTVVKGGLDLFGGKTRSEIRRPGLRKRIPAAGNLRSPRRDTGVARIRGDERVFEDV